ncbi:autotransporter outer membrane beta-barrel domain-containing protein [Bradyrhizobium sp. STM 3809]|uniref:autotransporter family protein n=1 Tax=Bradyrhizobium sp. STM 3809 TaxID=551936 RepID=UPI0002ECFDF7|nr:autotransporter outer membrane beta-barrel domain-containing protein [Bradyrhizobium sp. STM 3809]
MTGTGNLGSLNASVTGGAGGTGGVAGGRGQGGSGGIGLLFSNPLGATAIINAPVTGGDSGPGNSGGGAGEPGAGIVGQNLDLTINSAVIGGIKRDNSNIRANPITFTGGVNHLTLAAGAAITGNVTAFSTADTLGLGGATDASFDLTQIGSKYLGFGRFAKTGSSSWQLTGSNPSAMPWTISSGVLNVSGSAASATFTADGGTLGGSGLVGGAQINNGGTLAPGNGTAGSSISIANNLAFQSGAAYLVQLSPAAASFASVGGTATLGGATVQAVFANGSYVATTYTVLTAAGGVSGTFAPAVASTNLPVNFRTTLSYDANDVYLSLSFAFPQGLNANQQQVGQALTGFFNSTGGIPLVYGTLTPAGLTQAAGELGTGTQQATFDAMGRFTGLLTDPFAGSAAGDGGSDAGTLAFAADGARDRQAGARNAFAWLNGSPSSGSDASRWSVWASGFGGTQRTTGDAAAGTSAANSSLYGTAVGADYRLAPGTTAGFALAGGGTAFNLAASGSGRSDLFQAAAYFRHWSGPSYVAAALAYGWQDVTTDRTVTIAGTDRLHAEFKPNAYSGRLEAGHRVVAPWLAGIALTPYAAAQLTRFDLPAYAEQVSAGTGAFALTYAAKSVTATRSEIGLRGDRSFAQQDGVLTLRGRLAWAHDFNVDRSLAATFQALPGASFVVNGARPAADSALATATAEIRWHGGWSAAASFEGEFSKVTSSYAGRGVLRYAW